MRTLFLVAGIVALLAGESIAQPGGGRGGRGGDTGGGRGGATGGGFPSRGGDTGGTRGGFPSRGGETGGGRGGFNPADIIKRFDRNNDGMIAPDEAQGPAQFLLQRMAQSNPKIDLSKPIPISQLTEAMSTGRGGTTTSGGTTQSGTDEEMLLVPDFSLDFLPEPLLGFGAGSEVYAVQVEERDTKEAEERMRRYDTNKDGSLDANELKSGRWSDDPMSYDRNRDGKISTSEMAVRYANRRVAEVERRSASTTNNRDPRSGWTGGSRSSWTQGRGEKEPEKTVPDRFGDAKSYRVAGDSKTDGEGLPGFFSQRDANGDGQVEMPEFSSSWNNETLTEFLKWDVNGDGIIEPRECLAVLRSGGSSSSSGSSTASKGSSSRSSSSSAKMGGATVEWAKRQIGKYDKNNDGQLTSDEWGKMIIKPTGADYNKDGVITLEEYAKFRSGK